MSTRVRRDTPREATDDGIDIWWISPETVGELRALLGTCARPLAAYHRIGELMARVRPRGPSPFDGTGWFRAFAARLGCSTQLLGRCQRLAELYSRAAVARMSPPRPPVSAPGVRRASVSHGSRRPRRGSAVRGNVPPRP